MKRTIVFLLTIILICFCSALAEEPEAWMTSPVITKAYEISSGNLYLEWEGQAPVYQVYMDGQCVTSVIVNNAIVSVSKGTHSIVVYPISETKSADTKIQLGVGGELKAAGSLETGIGLDLAVLGLDPKKLTAGNPSSTLSIDYSPSSIFNSSPEQLQAITDGQDRVLLSFTDRYHADEYIVTIKIGNDVNHVKFTRGSEADAFIQQNKTTVTLTLDPAFLDAQECIVPELDSQYTLTVQLRKHVENMLDGEPVLTVLHQSKESSGYKYTPVAAWKTAPVISYASQTADGQITLRWNHEDYDRGCTYVVLKINKTFGIKTSEEELGTTDSSSFIINDLMNGDYSLAVVPVIDGVKGSVSAEANVSVQNDWVVAPMLVCEEIGSNSVRLAWTAVDGVESYHITVHKGDSESLLRFIDLDYSKYAEYDLPAVAGDMEYIFTYDGEINAETGMKFKFEIYGIRHTGSGAEQKTGVSTQALTIGLTETDVE